MNVVKKWAYYSEFEPYAVEWLRNLIAKGLIAPGEVDERSIVDVQPDDLKGFVQCHFFAGVAGWSLGLRRAGWPDDRPVWTGSCPCQPFSVAGLGKGQADERHLWPVFFRLIKACRPAVVFGEQVAIAAGAKPEPAFDLQREVEAMARAQPGTFARNKQGQSFGESGFESDLGCEEAVEAEKFALRLGLISRAVTDTNREGLLRVDGTPVQDDRRSAGLEFTISGSSDTGRGLRDRERTRDLVRSERDDADVGSRNHDEDDRGVDGEGTSAEGEFPSTIRGEPGEPSAKDWLDGVLTNFQEIAYTGGAAIAPCCAVNAPHRRDRLWFVADRSVREQRGLRQSGAGAGPGELPTGRHGGLVSPSDVADAERVGREMAVLDAGSGDASDRDGQTGQSGMRGAFDVAEPDSVAERQGNPFAGGRYGRDRTGEEPGLGGACDGDVADAIEERRDSGRGHGASGQRSAELEAFDNGPFGGSLADASGGDAQRRGRPGIVPGASGEVEGQLSQLAAAPDHRQGNVFDGGDVADATSERSQGRTPSGQRQPTSDLGPFSSGSGELHDLVNPFGTGLEGLAGNGADGREPGWIDADAARSVAPSGGAVPDADLAGSGAEREQRSGEPGGSGSYPGHRHWDAAIWIVGADGKARRVGARLRGLVDGVPDDVAGMRAGGYAEVEIETIPLLAHGVKARVGKLRALGNAIVPDLAAEIIGAYLDTHP